jgi:hypothetical protein
MKYTIMSQVQRSFALRKKYGTLAKIGDEEVIQNACWGNYCY